MQDETPQKGICRLANKKYKKSISFSLSNNGVLEARNVKEHEKGKFAFDLYFMGLKLTKINSITLF